METNLKIIQTIKDRLKSRHSLTAGYKYDEEDLQREKTALRQDIDFAVTMLETIIEIETPESEAVEDKGLQIE